MSDGQDHDDGGHHHERPASPIELRARALEALLIEKGLVSTDAIDAVIELYENDVGPQNGAKVVARARVDRAYRELQLADGAGRHRGARLRRHGRQHDGRRAEWAWVHNTVVCTLCSGYPWPVPGLPPSW
jgi:nitrile hydratase